MSVDEYQNLTPYAKELETNWGMLTYADVCYVDVCGRISDPHSLRQGARDQLGYADVCCADAGRPPGQLNSDGANLLVYGTP